MTQTRTRPALGAAFYLTLMCLLAMYFTFASVQGDYGLFRRIQITAEKAQLEAERETLRAEVLALENKTRRLSDNYLDLELLDQQARDILGMIRPDEIILH